MKPRLQNFDHKSSAYERPTLKWVCGRASTGKPCALGPNNKGKCRTLSECRPKRSGNDWVCTRSASAGGPCRLGPSPEGRCCHDLPPCLPVRSLRSRRGHLTGWVTVACLAMILLVFGGRMNANLVDPGTLYTGHAEIEDCAACHRSFDDGPLGWFRASVAANNPIADSDRCLNCHKWGGNSLNPHNVPKPELAELTTAMINVSRNTAASDPWTVQASRLLFPIPPQTHNGTLSCGACHKEHVGEDANLVEVANARCQSCHEMTFNGFSDGHPPLDVYPYFRRTRVIFDHDSHNRKNFPEKRNQGVDVPETCDTCHAPDGTGQFMLVADFDDTCARCHTGDLAGDSVAGPKGTPIIAVPELDLETMQDRGIAIGEWPEAIAYDISPYTKLLIAAESRVADDLETIAETDLQDLSDASDAEIQAVGRVAWAIKELLFDMTISGMDVLRAKVEASLQTSLDTDTLGRLVGHIPQDVVAAAGQAWFPNLKQEVVAYRAVKPVGQSAPTVQGDAGGALTRSLQSADAETYTGEDAADLILAQAGTIQVEELPNDSEALNDALGLPTLDPEEWAKAGGWYRKDFILYYRPVGHEDVVFRTWMDIAGRSFGTPAERYGDALFQLLADKNTPGKCTKCHSIDQQPGGSLTVNWSTFQPLAGESRFTNFVHATHFSAVGDEGCITCHQLHENTNYQESYSSRDPEAFIGNFAPMKRDTCATCHVQQSAGDNCTMCHNYHIGAEFATESIPATRIDDLDKEKAAPEQPAGDAAAPVEPEIDANAADQAEPRADLDESPEALPNGGQDVADSGDRARRPNVLGDLLAQARDQTLSANR